MGGVVYSESEYIYIYLLEENRAVGRMMGHHVTNGLASL